MIKIKPSNEPVLDNYFFRYLFKEPKGELTSTPEGKNVWMTKEQFISLEHKFYGSDEYIRISEEETIVPYSEEFIIVDEI